MIEKMFRYDPWGYETFWHHYKKSRGVRDIFTLVENRGTKHFSAKNTGMKHFLKVKPQVRNVRGFIEPGYETFCTVKIKFIRPGMQANK